jgi:uncharacterized protein (TIGR02001 family)
MKLKAFLLATALMCGAPAVASAQEVTTSFNVGAATNYVFRGLGQNIENDAQVFAGADITYGSFYAGTWASNVNFGGEADYEVDLYAGFKPKAGPIQFDFGVVGYLYPQEDVLNVVEYKGAATYTTKGGIGFTGSVFYSPELGEGGSPYWYSELAASAPIPGAKIGPMMRLACQITPTGSWA